MSFELNKDDILRKALEMAASKMEENPKVAEILLRQSLKVEPENPEALLLLGLSLYRSGKLDDSIDCFNKSIAINPQEADAYNNLALAYAGRGEYEKSTECLEIAVSLKPRQYLYLNNLALQYRQSGQFEKAISCFEEAIEISPSPMVWCNLGGIYADLKQWEKAESCYRHAIEIDKNLAAPHVFLSYIHGYKEDWQKAFSEYEWRFDHFEQLKYYNQVYDQRNRWTGSNLDGKTIILYGEQGLGDQIQYVRYVKKLKEQNAYTIVHCSELLKTLFENTPYVDEVLVIDVSKTDSNKLPKHDYHCSLMSLPFILKDFNPTGEPYINPASILKIDSVKEYSNQINVGIVWAGSPLHPNDQFRSMHLKEFSRLQMDGMRLFNLQVGESKRFYTCSKKTIDLAEGGNDIKLIDLVPLMKDFKQSASVISGLDLIISVDTSIVHLAGSIGVPCWVLLPYNSDWRWGTDGSKTRWYNSLKLFRQEQPGDWTNLMELVRKELRLLIDSNVNSKF